MTYKEVREFLYKRDDGKCFYCGKDLPIKGWHLEHVLPKIKYDNHSIDNLVASCKKCNFGKGRLDNQNAGVLSIIKKRNVGLSDEIRKAIEVAVREHSEKYCSADSGTTYAVIDVMNFKVLYATTKNMIAKNTSISRYKLIDFKGRRIIKNYLIVELKRGMWV
jgi:hypothetical protein